MGEEIILCFSNPTATDSLSLWAVMILLSCFVCIFGVYFIYLMWTKMERDSSIAFSIQLGCTAIAVCFMASSVLFCIHVGTSMFCMYGYDILEWVKLAIAATFFNQFGLSLMYLLYVFRLSFPFQGTVLATSKLLWIIFFIGFILISVFGTAFILVLTFAPPEKWEEWGLTARILYQITNLVFSIILLAVFLKKMLSLHDADLLKKVIRPIICAAAGLLSSQLLDSVISSIRQSNASHELWMLHSILFMLDELINLFCLYLQFPFGVKAFDKICGKLENICTKNVIKISGLKDVVELESNTRPKSGTNSTVTNDATTNSTVTISPDYTQSTPHDQNI